MIIKITRKKENDDKEKKLEKKIEKNGRTVLETKKSFLTWSKYRNRFVS